MPARLNVKMAVAAASVVVLITVVMVVLGQPRPAPAAGRQNLVECIGWRVENATGGWNITITGGGGGAAGLKLEVVDPRNGTSTVLKSLPRMRPEDGDPEAVWNDSNDNDKLDTGDVIFLSAASPNIQGGFKVRLIHENTFIASIPELP